MTAPLLNERDIAFMLYEFLNCESLCERERYADHNRESFDAAIATDAPRCNIAGSAYQLCSCWPSPGSSC